MLRMVMLPARSMASMSGARALGARGGRPGWLSAAGSGTAGSRITHSPLAIRTRTNGCPTRNEGIYSIGPGDGTKGGIWKS